MDFFEKQIKNLGQTDSFPSYKVENLLGKGETSLVFKVKILTESQNPDQLLKKQDYFALKEYNLDQIQEKIKEKFKNYREIMSFFIQREFEIAQKLQKILLENYAFLRYFNYRNQEDQSKILVLTQFYQQGDYSSMMEDPQKSQNRTLQQKISWAFQLIQQLVDLQENGISHRDLKPDNIFVSDDLTQLVIGDFGSACESYQKNPENFEKEIKLLKVEADQVGSVYFRPPDFYEDSFKLLQKQCFKQEEQKEEQTKEKEKIQVQSLKEVSDIYMKWDIWSVGLLIFFILVDDLPYEYHPSDYQFMKKEVKGLLSQFNYALQNWDIVQSALQEQEENQYQEFQQDTNKLRYSIEQYFQENEEAGEFLQEIIEEQSFESSNQDILEEQEFQINKLVVFILKALQPHWFRITLQDIKQLFKTELK